MVAPLGAKRPSGTERKRDVEPACKPNSVPACAAKIIHLPRALPRWSSNLPGSFQRKRAVPLLPYLVLLRRGFTSRSRSRGPRCALTAPFHPCLLRVLAHATIGGLFSVALSVALPRLDVIQPAARRSSDFPPRPDEPAAAILRSAPRQR